MTEKNAPLIHAFGLSNRTALVTGAGSGLAETIAQILALAGASVIVAHDVLSEAGRVASTICESGGTARAVACDVKVEADVIALFEDCAARGEIPDIIVMGAMMQGGVPAIDMSASQWDAMYEINARGAFLTAREAIRQLKRVSMPGRIIALSTMGSEHPVLVGNAAYGSSKAALNQLCRQLAFEHAADGIRVNAVLPGAVPGNAPKMVGATFVGGPGADPSRHLSGFGKPADVGWLVVYLAGPSADYITGQTFVIDGGFGVG
ncbi:SDR family oxidoreductase [Novosphingobium sp. ERN07]|uniref:SDR family NAD(P)-dependent oxidoreductase n=1 Tax=Novosphingobium sp. ERN07 TaxID=2726187 RepID=UPI0014576649|nr:SDR family oxidoreductase [Novosphingobium sp. ERN07]NLR72777.1 SDR family oxidoreductase [Novosphingobium sp. ERN07]